MVVTEINHIISAISFQVANGHEVFIMSFYAPGLLILVNLAFCIHSCFEFHGRLEELKNQMTVIVNRKDGERGGRLRGC